MLPNETPNFEFLLFDGFSNMVLANALEPLRDVKMQTAAPSVSWKISTTDGRSVKSSSGLTITPDAKFDVTDEIGTLFLVAGYNVRRHVKKELLEQLREANRAADRIVALDTASWLLAASGVLDGLNATIHWQEQAAFQETFDNVSVTGDPIVHNSRIVTCGGASAVFDLMIGMIETTFGQAPAFNAAKMFSFEEAGQYNIGKPKVLLQAPGSQRIMRALKIMNAHIETPLSTKEIAALLNSSERSLNRLFLNEIGLAPGKYYRQLRLQTAQHLALETSLSGEQIALRTGFSTGASLARAFRSVFGQSLGEMRHSAKEMQGDDIEAHS